jgi:peptide/nickel transport system substrate-binding protein
MKKKLARIVLIGLIQLVIVLSGTVLPAAEAPRRGGTLTVATDSEPVGLDPQLSITFSTTTFIEFVYDTLIRFNARMELEPSLATSWESPDPLNYTFHLRKGVKFHNGAEMTSEDVKFSFDRLVDPKVGAPRGLIFDLLDKVEAPDRYTVRIRLKKAFPFFLETISYVRNAPILSKTEVQKQGTMQQTTCGTGPFRLDKYVHGVSGDFVRHEGYWETGLPYLDGFKLIVIKDSAAMLAAIRKGAVDIGWVKEAHLADLAARGGEVNVIESAAARQGRFMLNHKVFPFNNVKLRQAVSACLDRKEIIDKVLLGRGVLTTSIPPSSVPYALPPDEIARLPFHRQDYALVKKLLQEAGHPNGFSFVIKTSPHSPDYVPACEIIQRQLAKAGIQASIQQMDWGVFQKVRRTLDFQANLYAGSWFPDPAGYVYAPFYGPATSNESGQNTPEVNELLDLCVTTTDLQKRIDLWKKLQVKMAEDVTAIWPYASSARFELVSKKVKGYSFLASSSRVGLREAWIQK